MHVFETILTLGTPETAEIRSGSLPPIAFSSPKSLGGTGTDWSPEELLIGAVQSCFYLTAMHFISKAGIQLKTFDVRAGTKMEKTPEGLRLTSFQLDVNAVPVDTARAVELDKALHLGEKYCPVSASLKVPVKLVIQIG